MSFNVLYLLIVVLDSHGSFQVIVYQDTAAMLTNDNLFVLTDFSLTLRRDRIEATTAGITLYCYHSQTVTVVLTDFFVSLQ